MTAATTAQIIQAYSFGLTMKQVAKLTGASKARVAKVIIHAGVERRELTPPVPAPALLPEPKVKFSEAEGISPEEIVENVSRTNSAKDLHRMTMRALEAIAKREGWPIGMTMAMCGLNPESRAVLL